MRPIYVASVLCLCLLLSLTSAQAERAAPQTQFFTSIQDMPLMPGLLELADQTVVFDKPQGRIVESVAEINAVSVEAIKNYYKSAMPQLGWSQISENNFVRENEHLRMSFERIEGDSFLRIMVSPR